MIRHCKSLREMSAVNTVMADIDFDVYNQLLSLGVDLDKEEQLISESMYYNYEDSEIEYEIWCRQEAEASFRYFYPFVTDPLNLEANLKEDLKWLSESLYGVEY